MGNVSFDATFQLANARTCANAGNNYSAKGGKLANAVFDVYGDKVGYRQRAEKLLLAFVGFFGLGNNRYRESYALVARSAVDNNGHFATIHARITCSTCQCFAVGQNVATAVV